jgi:hypothetical protein
MDVCNGVNIEQGLKNWWQDLYKLRMLGTLSEITGLSK